MDPFDTRRSYIPTPTAVQPDKAPDPDLSGVHAEGSEYAKEFETGETALIAREII